MSFWRPKNPHCFKSLRKIVDNEIKLLSAGVVHIQHTNRLVVLSMARMYTYNDGNTQYFT